MVVVNLEYSARGLGDWGFCAVSHLSLIARSSMWRSLMLFLETESHFLNSEVIAPSVAVIDGITFRFIFHISVSSFSDWYFSNFSISADFWFCHMSGWLAGIFLSIWIAKSCRIFALLFFIWRISHLVLRESKHYTKEVFL